MSSSLVDFGKSIYNKLQPEKRAGAKTDPAWHDSMVKSANESFSKKGVGTASRSKVAAKKKTKKSTKRFGK